MAENRAPAFLATVVISTGVTLAVVTLRIGYRWSKSCLILSDYMIVLAMLSSVLHLALDITITVHYGYGRHEADLPPSLRNSYKTGIVFWLIQIITKLPLLFSKISVCLIYRSLFKLADMLIVRISRAVNYFTMFLIITFFSAVTLVSAFSCIPFQKIWHPKVPGRCVNNTILLYVTSAVNILTSLLIICTPLPVLFQVSYRRIENKQLIALVLLGLVYTYSSRFEVSSASSYTPNHPILTNTCASDTGVSCVRLYMTGTLANEKLDFTWIIIPIHIAIVIEYNMTIIAASLIVMRPCFQAIFNWLFPNSNYNTGHSSGTIIPTFSGYQRSLSRKDRSGKSERIDDNDEEGSKGLSITKTVDVELSTRCVSTEILRSDDRF